MCLGIAMQVVSIEGHKALCEAQGIQRTVSLFALQDEAVIVGDYVIIHVGYAIQKITEQEARSLWELQDELFGLDTGLETSLETTSANPPRPSL